jgi:hypothetical protein
MEQAADHARLLERIDHLFRLHGADDGEQWAVNALRRLVTEYRVGKGAA